MKQEKLIKIYVFVAIISLEPMTFGSVCINTTSISAQQFLDSQENSKVTVVVAANDGKPFGASGNDTHRGRQKGKLSFRNAFLQGGGQEESIVSSMRAGLALVGVPEKKYLRAMFTRQDKSTPIWGLKDINGELYQGGNLNEVTIHDLANGKGKAKGMKPIAHKVSNAPIATPAGDVILANLIFTAGPNFTANNGRGSSTHLTQIKDFKNNPYRANNKSEFNTYYSDVRSYLKTCYRAVLNQLDGDEDYVLVPKLSSNIYSKLHKKDSLLSSAIQRDTKSLLSEVLSERRFSNKFSGTAFTITEPSTHAVKRELTSTQHLYQTAIQERRKHPSFRDRHEEFKNKKKIEWFSKENRLDLKHKYDEIQKKRSSLLYCIFHTMKNRFR